MRIMAIDYGDQRIGLAVSDERAILVGDAWTMKEWNMERAVKRIGKLVTERNIGKLVLVVLWDERRSSIEAHAILHANGRKEKDHRKNVDAVAASLMLEGYLGSI